MPLLPLRDGDESHSTPGDEWNCCHSLLLFLLLLLLFIQQDGIEFDDRRNDGTILGDAELQRADLGDIISNLCCCCFFVFVLPLVLALPLLPWLLVLLLLRVLVEGLVVEVVVCEP